MARIFILKTVNGTINLRIGNTDKKRCGGGGGGGGGGGVGGCEEWFGGEGNGNVLSNQNTWQTVN